MDLLIIPFHKKKLCILFHGKIHGLSSKVPTIFNNFQSVFSLWYENTFFRMRDLNTQEKLKINQIFYPKMIVQELFKTRYCDRVIASDENIIDIN